MPGPSHVAAVVLLLLGLLGTLAWLVLRTGPIEELGGGGESRSNAAAARAATAARAVDSETPPPDLGASRSVAEVPADATVTGATVRGAPPVDPLQLKGRVVTRAGKAILGAEVGLSLCDADGFRCLDPEYAKEVERVADARTDLDGRFAFAVHRARRYRLLVRAVGCSPFEAKGCVGGQDGVFVMDPGLTLVGRVTEKGTDRPLGGAHVRAFEPDSSTDLWRTETDPDGWYRIEGLRAVLHYVEVVTDDSTSSHTHALAPDQRNRCDFELSAGETIEGAVTDAVTGQPIAGAQVSESETFGKFARTDANGRYLLRGAPSSKKSVLHVRAEGCVSRMRAVAQTGNRQTQDFALRQGGSVIGRCLDAAGRPLAGVYVVAAGRISLPPYPHTEWLPARSGPDGAFRVSGLAPAPAGPSYTLYFRHAGLGTRTYDLPRAVARGEILDVGEVRLAAGGLIEGRVVDEAGHGVAGALVRIEGSNNDSRRLCTSASSSRGTSPAVPYSVLVSQFAIRTRSDGWFRFGQLSEGRYVVKLSPPARFPERDPELGANRDPVLRVVDAQSRGVDLAPGETRSDLSFTLPTGATLVVRAVTPQGLAVTAERFGAALTPEGHRPSTYALADHEGRIAISGLPPGGSYTIEFFGEPDGWMMPVIEDVTVSREELRVVAKVAAWIEGTVLDQDGKPAIGWMVFGRRSGTPAGSAFGNNSTSKSDTEGRFRLRAREGEIWDLTVESWDGPRPEEKVRRDRVPVGTTDLVLRP